jgi:type II secretion system protein G
MQKRESGFTLIELLIVIAIIGILAAIAIPNLLNAVQRGKQKRTMSDMRSMATAIEAYAVDTNFYPPPNSCASGIFSTIDGQINTTSFTRLSPTYIAQPPRTDGWGGFIFYGFDTSDYAIVSAGRDKTTAALVCGTTTDFNADIVYGNGTFIQWPEGVQN